MNCHFGHYFSSEISNAFPDKSFCVFHVSLTKPLMKWSLTSFFLLQYVPKHPPPRQANEPPIQILGHECEPTMYHCDTTHQRIIQRTLVSLNACTHTVPPPPPPPPPAPAPAPAPAPMLVTFENIMECYGTRYSFLHSMPLYFRR